MNVTGKSLEAIFDVLERNGIKPNLDDRAELLESVLIWYINGCARINEQKRY